MTPQPTYHLYHREALWFPYGGAIADPLDPEVLGWPARYRHVADLEAGSLEAAYALSQHLERAWWHNPGVSLHIESRSTSVGDVLLDAAGAAWAVAPLGFVRLAAGEHPRENIRRENIRQEGIWRGKTRMALTKGTSHRARPTAPNRPTAATHRQEVEMYPHKRFVREGFTAQRACGRRAAGGVYAETRLSDAGLPLEHFLLCPPRPVDLAAFGLAAVGVQLVEYAGAWHVCDVVGREHYPHVADFVEETRRKGASRRLPRNLDFARLNAASRLVLIHARAILVNFDRYPQPPVAACPKDVHRERLAEPCAGLWWHDLPEAALERWEDGGLTYRSLPGGVTYSAYPRPAGIAPVYQHGIFLSLPITNLSVIAGRNPQEEQKAEEAYRSANLSGLPVYLEEE